jgi:hypothetical protein
VASYNLEFRRTGKERWRQLAASGQLYAVVETCHQKGVREKARELGPARAISLFQDTYEAQYENAAPFFFHVDQATFDWIAASFWGRPWGILIWAETAFHPLRVHLHKFLRVRGVNQTEYLLRFYDPYILGPFLKSCNDAELAQFFGPVSAFGASEGEDVTAYRLTAPPK